MAELKLRFKSIMQSWGVPEPWLEGRGTYGRPTESAIYGMIGCAMGIRRDEKVRMEELKQKISVTPHEPEIEPSRLTDTQTVHAIADGLIHIAANGKKRTVTGGLLFSKQYLQDTETYATIKGSDEDIERAKYALDHPIYPYYLGRYCCTPCERVVCEE